MCLNLGTTIKRLKNLKYQVNKLMNSQGKYRNFHFFSITDIAIKVADWYQLISDKLAFDSYLHISGRINSSIGKSLVGEVLFMIICLHRNGKRRLFKTQKVPGHYSLTRAFLPKNEFYLPC